MHHHYREKQSKNFGHPFLEIVADINGVIGGFALYPQVIKVFQTHNMEGLSFITFLIIFFNSVIWLYYGISKRITPLRISSALNVTAAGSLLFFAFFLG